MLHLLVLGHIRVEDVMLHFYLKVKLIHIVISLYISGCFMPDNPGCSPRSVMAAKASKVGLMLLGLVAIVPVYHDGM